MLISSCINGKGPYRLIVDTGSTISALVPEIAEAVRLPDIGVPRRADGALCKTTAQRVRITNWSIGPVRLAPQEIVSARFPGLATESGAVGILGADVLSRFGAVTINYSLGDLLIPGPEGPPSSGVHLIKGPTDKATPSALLAGLPPPINVPLTVSSINGNVSAFVSINIGSPPELRPFIVDTGSSISAISISAATQLKLTPLSTRIRIGGIGCQTRASLVDSGAWSMSGVALASGRLAEFHLSSSMSRGYSGTLGSDQLSQFGSVILDFTGARLLLFI